MEITSIQQAEEYEHQIRNSASDTMLRIAESSAQHDPISVLELLKFEKIGCNPLNPGESWNVIEQVNQTFTYLASFRAVKLLFKWYPDAESFNLNLGTASGSDIESLSNGGIAAEVFAATTPNSNQKLQKDIRKVRDVKASHKYVFFMCPNITEGKFEANNAPGIKVWSLGV